MLVRKTGGGGVGYKYNLHFKRVGGKSYISHNSHEFNFFSFKRDIKLQ